MLREANPLQLAIQPVSKGHVANWWEASYLHISVIALQSTALCSGSLCLSVDTGFYISSLGVSWEVCRERILQGSAGKRIDCGGSCGGIYLLAILVVHFFRDLTKRKGAFELHSWIGSVFIVARLVNMWRWWIASPRVPRTFPTGLAESGSGVNYGLDKTAFWIPGMVPAFFLGQERKICWSFKRKTYEWAPKAKDQKGAFATFTGILDFRLVKYLGLGVWNTLWNATDLLKWK